MASENKNILLRVGANVEFADDVVNLDRATRRGSGEVVCFDLRSIFLQNPMDEAFGFLMAGAIPASVLRSPQL